MRTKIQYYIRHLSGRSRVMRFAYILTRAYKLNLWRLNRNLAETIRVFAKNAENVEIGRLKRSILGCMYQYGISPDEYLLYDF